MLGTHFVVEFGRASRNLAMSAVEAMEQLAAVSELLQDVADHEWALEQVAHEEELMEEPNG